MSPPACGCILKASGSTRTCSSRPISRPVRRRCAAPPRHKPIRTRMGMKRRTFLLAAAAAPLLRSSSAHAQGSRPAIGFLASGSPDTFATVVTSFLDGLKAAGLIEGKTVDIEYRWAQGQFNLLPSLAEELIRRPVDIVVTMGGNVAALAAKRATSAIPIVFLTSDDPVSSGLVGSLNRPGGNVTGVTWLAVELGAKNLELIGELMPSAGTIGVLVNPKRPTAEEQLRNASEAAAGIGKTLRLLYAGNKDEIDTAFATIARERIAVLFV